MAQLDWYIRANLKPRHLQLLVALEVSLQTPLTLNPHLVWVKVLEQVWLQ